MPPGDPSGQGASLNSYINYVESHAAFETAFKPAQSHMIIHLYISMSVKKHLFRLLCKLMTQKLQMQGCQLSHFWRETHAFM